MELRIEQTVEDIEMEQRQKGTVSNCDLMSYCEPAYIQALKNDQVY